MDHQAFAQSLGNYGEFVGAIAVVATLIYLSLQVRGTAEQVAQNLQATKTQNWQSVNLNLNIWRQMVLDADNSRIWFQGINDLTSLEREEKFMMAGAFDWSCWLTYQLQRNEGLMADVNSRLFRDKFMHAGYREWITLNLDAHSDDYKVFLEQVADEVGERRLRPGEFSSLSPGQY